MPINNIDPYKVEWAWDGPNEVSSDEPTPETLWYAPFHKALATGLVDGRTAHGRGPITVGAVSDHPHSVRSADGSSG